MTRSLVHVEMGDTEMCVGCLLGGSPQRPRGIQMHLNYLVLSICCCSFCGTDPKTVHCMCIVSWIYAGLLQIELFSHAPQNADM